MTKKTKIVMVILILIVLLIPIRSTYDDGGTVEYSAFLYSITDYHRLSDKVGGFDTGIEVKILGITVYENTTFDE